MIGKRFYFDEKSVIPKLTYTSEKQRIRFSAVEGETLKPLEMTDD